MGKLKEGEVAYYEKGGGQLTVMIHSIDEHGLAQVQEVGNEEAEIFEVELDRLQGPV